MKISGERSTVTMTWQLGSWQLNLVHVFWAYRILWVTCGHLWIACCVLQVTKKALLADDGKFLVAYDALKGSQVSCRFAERPAPLEKMPWGIHHKRMPSIWQWLILPFNTDSLKFREWRGSSWWVITLFWIWILGFHSQSINSTENLQKPFGTLIHCVPLTFSSNKTQP